MRTKSWLDEQYTKPVSNVKEYIRKIEHLVFIERSCDKTGRAYVEMRAKLEKINELKNK